MSSAGSVRSAPSYSSARSSRTSGDDSANFKTSHVVGAAVCIVSLLLILTVVIAFATRAEVSMAGGNDSSKSNLPPAVDDADDKSQSPSHGAGPGRGDSASGETSKNPSPPAPSPSPVPAPAPPAHSPVPAPEPSPASPVQPKPESGEAEKQGDTLKQPPDWTTGSMSHTVGNLPPPRGAAGMKAPGQDAMATVGTLGSLVLGFALLPQLLLVRRTKDVSSFSESMLWCSVGGNTMLAGYSAAQGAPDVAALSLWALACYSYMIYVKKRYNSNMGNSHKGKHTQLPMDDVV